MHNAHGLTNMVELYTSPALLLPSRRAGIKIVLVRVRAYAVGWPSPRRCRIEIAIYRDEIMSIIRSCVLASIFT